MKNAPEVDRSRAEEAGTNADAENEELENARDKASGVMGSSHAATVTGWNWCGEGAGGRKACPDVRECMWLLLWVMEVSPEKSKGPTGDDDEAEDKDDDDEENSSCAAGVEVE